MGRTTVEAFTREGATVVALDVNPSVSDSWAEIRAQYPGSAGFPLQCDISDLQECRRAVQEALERFGHIDVVAMIAGVLQNASPVSELSSQEWDHVMSVNLRGPFLLAKAVAPTMMERRAGKIIAISSWWGHSGHAYYSAYCCSKAGLIVLTQSLAAELAPYGITANCICPGNINTSMHQRALREEAEKRGIRVDDLKASEYAKIPLGRPGEPEDITCGVLFLASDDAGYITGASLDINGGVLFR